jgi:hypothetical protein
VQLVGALGRRIEPAIGDRLDWRQGQPIALRQDFRYHRLA